MVDQRPSLGLQLLCPHLALSLIDNFIAIKREEIRIVSEKSEDEQLAYYLHYI